MPLDSQSVRASVRAHSRASICSHVRPVENKGMRPHIMFSLALIDRLLVHLPGVVFVWPNTDPASHHYVGRSCLKIHEIYAAPRRFEEPVLQTQRQKDT